MSERERDDDDPPGPVPKVPLDDWRARIEGARTERAKFVDSWARNARLYAMARAIGPRSETWLDGQEDLLGRRDRIALGLVHRNAEQTMAVLDMPEVGLSATMVEFYRETTESDEAAENLVSAAVGQSLRDSGLLSGPKVADMVKQVALICGHGVSFTHWRRVTRDLDLGLGPVFEVTGEDADGGEILEPKLGDDGEPLIEPMSVTEVVREQCADVFVSPLDFLFDTQAPSIAMSGWHAFEQLVRLKDLQADGRFMLPDELEERTHRRVNLFNETPGAEVTTTKGVAVITAFDKATRQMCVFLEADRCQRVDDRHASEPLSRERAPLHCIMAETFPVDMASPDDSPFSAFVPMPLVDFPWGISQIGTIRVSAEMADKLESRLSTQTLDQKRIFLTDANSGVTEDAIRDAMRAPDFAVVSIQNGMGQDLSKLLTELPMQKVTEETFGGINRGKADVAATSGVADMPYGGAGTATESENMMAVGGARVQRKRQLYLQYLEHAAQVHLAYLATFAPDGQTIMVQGLWGAEPMRYGREAFAAGRFNLRAVPSGSAAADTPVQQKAKVDFAGMVAPFAGPALKLVLLETLATSLGLHDQARLRRAAIQDMQGSLAPPMGPGGVDGRLQGRVPSPEAAMPGQVMRYGINALNES